MAMLVTLSFWAHSRVVAALIGLVPSPHLQIRSSNPDRPHENPDGILDLEHLHALVVGQAFDARGDMLEDWQEQFAGG